MRNIILALLLFIPSAAFAAGGWFPDRLGVGTSAPRTTLEVDGNVYVMSSGKIGIGTTVPRGSLDVDGYIYGNGTMLTGVALSADEGAPNGIATLGADSKIPNSQLPASITGSMTYKGVLDADAGIYPSGPSTGDYYVISVAGDIEGITYGIGDWVAYNGSAWDKIDNSSSTTGWTSSGSNVYLITSGNNVGLGSATPQAKLDVEGTVYISGAATIEGGVVGNASTATKLATARTINNKSFDGTANITITQSDIDLSLYAPLASPTFTTPNIGVASGTSFSGVSATATSLATNPTDCAANQFANSIDASGNLTCSTPTTALSGLTANYITKATSATAIAISQIFDNATNVGIASSSPQAKLDVEGAVYISGLITAPSGMTGTASKATALAANGTNCSSGQAAQGVDTAGNAESCFAPGGWSTDDSTEVNTSYNVGINTSAPQQFLDVEGSVYVSSKVMVDGGIYSKGNVGINTSAPRQKLEVNSKSLFLDNVGIGTTAAKALLDVEGAVYLKGNVGINTSAPRQKLEVNSKSLFVDNVGIGSTSPGQKLVVDGGVYITGNVGINTVAPRGKLEVDGQVYIRKGSYAVGEDFTGDGIFTIGEPVTLENGGYARNKAYLFGDLSAYWGLKDTVDGREAAFGLTDNASVGYIGTISEHDFYIIVHGTQQISLEASSGYIGIGTTNPSYKVDVAGVVNATGFRSDGSYEGGTSTANYWVCTAANCSTTCQLQVHDGLMTGCL